MIWIAFLLGCFVGYTAMWIRHVMQMRQIIAELDITLAAVKAMQNEVFDAHP